MSLTNHMTPSLDNLRTEFAFIKASSEQGIQGVWRVDSGKPGPVLGITMHTHGNEPSGLAVLWYLRSHFGIAEKLKIGSVYFVLNNLEATEAYFEALLIEDKVAREKAKRLARSRKHNFNRLPVDTLKLEGDERYEIKRAQELWPIWSKFEAGLDIHSTTLESEPMIVACEGFRKKLIAGFPVDVVITNIDKIQVEKPAISFYGEPGKTTVIGIEAGSHENAQSFVCAIKCALALMENLKMISPSGEVERSAREYREYRICGSVIASTKSYKMAKRFKTFEPVRKGQVLARGNGTEIIAQADGHALFASSQLTPEFVGEEMIFLSQPVKTIKL